MSKAAKRARSGTNDSNRDHSALLAGPWNARHTRAKVDNNGRSYSGQRAPSDGNDVCSMISMMMSTHARARDVADSETAGDCI